MRKIYRRFAAILTLIFTFLMALLPCFSIAVEALGDPNSSFWIEYIDVGQGDSALIQCDGHYMMIDGGPSSASSIVYTILKNKEIKSLDYMIATHPDADHIGGLSGALNYAKVGICYSPVSNHDTKTFNSLVKYLNKQGISPTVPSSGTVFYLGSAKVELIGPIVLNADTNNNSIVTRITYGSRRFLFMGDAEYEEENSLINAKKDLSCDVLKVGHHGSSSSTSDALLAKAKPKYAVISVGKENSYGHPTAEVLNKFKTGKVTIYRTDKQGDIVLNSDGKSITFFTEKTVTTDTLWISGSGKDSAPAREVTNNSPSYDNIDIPAGTTYVLNINTKKFHLSTCGSVYEMSEKNRRYTTESASSLMSEGYKPCGRCNPYENGYRDNPTVVPNEPASVAQERGAGDAGIQLSVCDYVLNTNTKKFHLPSCSSVYDMSEKNKKDVQMSREDVISQGYTPCKRCDP